MISAPPAGTRQLLDELGAEGLAQWMLAQKRTLVTDTTMRDAHQSLIATRMRTFDMARVADAYAHNMSDLFSLECWGGATFDVAMRSLDECPWEYLRVLHQACPNILFQMLLRGSNTVGYADYPDNVVHHFVQQVATSGVDIFRVFHSLDWVENMTVAMDAVIESGKMLEAVICYTGDILNPARFKYNLDYYRRMAADLTKAGAHVIGLKDMAGFVKPDAARLLIIAIKEETDRPVYFHTHDTSGIAAASVLAAMEVGCDAVDAAMDSWSGLSEGRGAFSFRFQIGQAFRPLEALQHSTTIVFEFRPDGGKAGVIGLRVGPVDGVTRKVDDIPCIRQSGHGMESFSWT